MADLRALAERYICLSSEIEGVRRAMLVCLSNGLDHDEASAPGEPAAAKPNGKETSLPVYMPPRPAKAEAKTNFEAVRRAKLTEARTAEQRLMEAMQLQGNLTGVALANLVNASRSSTGERLRRLAQAGKVEKDRVGRWKLVEEGTLSGRGAASAPFAAVAELTPAAAQEAEHARWVKPLSSYERKETTIVEGLRYG